MTIFIVSWFVSGFVIGLITRFCEGKMRVQTWLNSIIGGYYTVFVVGLFWINKDILDKEI